MYDYYQDVDDDDVYDVGYTYDPYETNHNNHYNHMVRRRQPPRQRLIELPDGRVVPMESYVQMKKQYEREQRQMEKQRELQRRKALEERKRLEREERRRQQEHHKQFLKEQRKLEQERQRRRKLELEQQAMKEEDAADSSSSSEDEEEFQLFRGLDGRLFHARNPAYDRQQKKRRNRARLARKKEESERRRRRYEEQQQQSMVDEDEESDYEDAEEFEIVRGRDGRLYTVRKEQQKQPKKKVLATGSIDKNNEVVSMDDDSDSDSDSSSSDEDVPMKVSSSNVTTKKSTPTTTSIPIQKVSGKSDGGKLSAAGGNKKRKHQRIVGVIVEDASDSEYENEEYRSPWRNRRPSPGQWIEPVENFVEKTMKKKTHII